MNVAIHLADEDFSFITDRMSRWVEGVLGREYHHYRPDQTWSPAVNLYEDASDYYLVADLAGIDPEAIDLHVQKNRLMLHGERPFPRLPGFSGARGGGNPARAGLHLHHMEIEHGPFLRTVDLPESIVVRKIEAYYRNGFLWVKMPKKQ